MCIINVHLIKNKQLQNQTNLYLLFPQIDCSNQSVFVGEGVITILGLISMCSIGDEGVISKIFSTRLERLIQETSL